MTVAAENLQTYIDAQQDVDALTYGLRSIKTCGRVSTCTGPHAGQLVRAAQTAARVLGRVIVPSDDPTVTPWLIREALKLAKDDLKLAKSERGGRKQERLALAA
ncbi:MAG: hypothetical protein LC798_12880 [Chloroflexi bacterium]|nr:hypothetical protein [Chloroflexota bacterium]